MMVSHVNAPYLKMFQSIEWLKLLGLTTILMY
jgi:hypothetical protein